MPMSPPALHTTYALEYDLLRLGLLSCYDITATFVLLLILSLYTTKYSLSLNAIVQKSSIRTVCIISFRATTDQLSPTSPTAIFSPYPSCPQPPLISRSPYPRCRLDLYFPHPSLQDSQYLLRCYHPTSGSHLRRKQYAHLLRIRPLFVGPKSV